jgi:dihydropteroate synthase
MELITLHDAAEKHGLNYVTLMSRVKKNKIKSVARKGHYCFFDYEALKAVLFPVDADFQARRVTTLKANKAGVEKLLKDCELEFFDRAKKDLNQFELSKQSKKERAVVSSWSIYG